MQSCMYVCMYACQYVCMRGIVDEEWMKCTKNTYIHTITIQYEHIVWSTIIRKYVWLTYECEAVQTNMRRINCNMHTYIHTYIYTRSLYSEHVACCAFWPLNLRRSQVCTQRKRDWKEPTSSLEFSPQRSIRSLTSPSTYALSETVWPVWAITLQDLTKHASFDNLDSIRCLATDH
jgi:hypothetical protein